MPKPFSGRAENKSHKIERAVLYAPVPSIIT